MRTEHVSIGTTTAPLDGAFYEPEGEIVGANELFQGNRMNFYVGADDAICHSVTGWLQTMDRF